MAMCGAVQQLCPQRLLEPVAMLLLTVFLRRELGAWSAMRAVMARPGPFPLDAPQGEGSGRPHDTYAHQAPRTYGLDVNLYW